MSISEAPASSERAMPTVSPVTRRGILMPIGGAEDKFDDKIILSTFAQLAGGKHARIAIVPTASSIETAGLRYKAIFLGMGVARGRGRLHRRAGTDANSDEVVEHVRNATGIFLTGGNQMRLSAMIGGTRFEQVVREANQNRRDRGRHQRRGVDPLRPHGRARRQRRHARSSGWRRWWPGSA